MFYNNDINIIEALLGMDEGVELEKVQNNEYVLTVPDPVICEMYDTMNEELKNCEMEQYSKMENFIKDLCEDLVPELLDYEVYELKEDFYYFGTTELIPYDLGFKFRFKIYEIDEKTLEDQNLDTKEQESASDASAADQTCFAVVFRSMSDCMRYYKVLDKSNLRVQMFKKDGYYGIMAEGDCDSIISAKQSSAEYNGIQTTVRMPALEEHGLIIADDKQLKRLEGVL